MTTSPAPAPGALRIGEVYRYPRPALADTPIVDGLPNFFFVTRTPDLPRVQLESGIDAPAAVTGPDGHRRPTILIRSSPSKAGTAETPWQDYFDPDHGHIRYFGDGKVGHHNAAVPKGNRLLIEQALHWLSDAPSGREAAAPLLFFLGTSHDGRRKGQVRFQGFGVLERAEVVAQVDAESGVGYSNYRYDFSVLRLDDESIGLPWEWIARRRNPALTTAEADKAAPASWRRWKELGPSGLGLLRRRLSSLREVSKASQVPETPHHRVILSDVHGYYARGVKHHLFEGLAEVVTDHILRREGLNYSPGWITRRSGDEGIDFVGRFDVGSGLAMVSVVLLGQAKCTKPGNPVSGRDVARVVARLRRGWIGAFVTTGYFSRGVQREIIDDEYPILLIGGAQFARAVSEMLDQRGMKSAFELCSALEATYIQRLVARRPHEILLD